MVSGPVSSPYAVFRVEDWSPACAVPAQGLGPCASPCSFSVQVQVQGELFEFLLPARVPGRGGEKAAAARLASVQTNTRGPARGGALR
jgi:hypothetical protein